MIDKFIDVLAMAALCMAGITGNVACALAVFGIWFICRGD